jgi:hypothetical protein
VLASRESRSAKDPLNSEKFKIKVSGKNSRIGKSMRR